MCTFILVCTSSLMLSLSRTLFLLLCFHILTNMIVYICMMIIDSPISSMSLFVPSTLILWCGHGPRCAVGRQAQLGLLRDPALARQISSWGREGAKGGAQPLVKGKGKGKKGPAHHNLTMINKTDDTIYTYIYVYMASAIVGVSLILFSSSSLYGNDGWGMTIFR